MNLRDGRLVTSPTDLANFLTCRHKTALDLLVAQGTLARPNWNDPFAAILRDRGALHEAMYVDALRADGLAIVEIAADLSHAARLTRTRDAMHAGADVIVQAALGNDEWFGYADVLRKVETSSPALGAWSYEAHDTKLTRETKSGTILQLCVYSELIGDIQGVAPERFAVVTPVGHHVFRVDDFAAFHRQVKARLREFLASNTARTSASTYPDPVDHCVVCRWSARCRAEMRKADHLSFVAGLGRTHRAELVEQDVPTLASLAALPLPVPFKPSRGSKGTYERLREQARLQFEQRESGRLVFETLPVEENAGLCLLPEPRPGDLFLDLEGDPFARLGPGLESGDGTREYLFGLGRLDADGTFQYRARWAFTDADECAAFDAVMGEIVTALDEDPAIHIFHYAPYEPSAFKRLSGRYAVREADLDRLLRGGRFVDLYAIVTRALRAGVERYSIKNLEPFYGFTRDVELEEAADQRRLVELALETGDVTSIDAGTREAVEGYNKDDCRSAWALRAWLEELRTAALAKGHDLTRPTHAEDAPTKEIEEREREAVQLRGQLLEGVPEEASTRTNEQHARYLLAYLVDFHRREDRVTWGEYHRLREKAVEDMLDEPTALVGLRFVERVFAPSGRRTAAIDRYAYPPQENDLRVKDRLKRPNDEDIGAVVRIDKTDGTIDIKKRVERNDTHPDVVLALRFVNADELEMSIRRVARSVITDGLEVTATSAVADLLANRPPRLTSSAFVPQPGQTTTDFALRAGATLDGSVLPIQGPPGAGKTYTGARMIAALVAAGRKVGVVANSHKVIRKLLTDAGAAANGDMPIAHKPGEDALPAVAGIAVDEPTDNPAARAWLEQPGGRVLGGTAWLWSRADFASSVDVLFVDEAGQMSLANAVAVSPAAQNVVLLGDPRQLDQPHRGSHPDGVEVSALDHLLGAHQTIPESRGIFLPTTWRLAPAICAFTSEMFYERKLASKAGLERQRITGSARFDGAGLSLVTLDHDGCRNASIEEADEVARVVADLLGPGVQWIDEHGVAHRMTPTDILVVAPYNAHVNILRERVGLPADRIGTVDKFQGQEAAVAIYSLATSRSEDAPRGMEFLYSLNRLNVATSRARCRSIVVGSAGLFEPACKTPRQMQLANALARVSELAIR